MFVLVPGSLWLIGTASCTSQEHVSARLEVLMGVWFDRPVFPRSHFEEWCADLSKRLEWPTPRHDSNFRMLVWWFNHRRIIPGFGHCQVGNNDIPHVNQVGHSIGSPWYPLNIPILRSFYLNSVHTNTYLLSTSYSITWPWLSSLDSSHAMVLSRRYGPSEACLEGLRLPNDSSADSLTLWTIKPYIKLYVKLKIYFK